VALTTNRKKLGENADFAATSGLPMLYMGGIDPVVRGADPEFCGKNAVLCADVTDGYWIFYEGPEVGKDHEDYWHWFTWANKAIAAGRFEAQNEPRETTDTWGTGVLEKKTDKPQIAVFSMKRRMYEQIEEEGTFEVHELRSNTWDYLKQLDVLVLQNFNVSLEWDSEWVRMLRKWVEDGGGLMLAHDTAWFMASPFPEMAVRDFPQNKVEAQRHVVETDLKVTRAHPGLGALQVGVQFSPEFRDHMIFKPGPEGLVVIENLFGDPVYIVGTFGKGRVVFTGSYYGYNKQLSGPEREAFFALLRWLKGD
jgi:hypothetical protein